MSIETAVCDEPVARMQSGDGPRREGTSPGFTRATNTTLPLPLAGEGWGEGSLCGPTSTDATTPLHLHRHLAESPRIHSRT